MTDHESEIEAVDIDATAHTTPAPEQPAPAEPAPDPRYSNLEAAVVQAAADVDDAAAEVERCISDHDAAEASFLGNKSDKLFTAVETARRARDRAELVLRGAKAAVATAKAALVAAQRGDLQRELDAHAAAVEAADAEIASLGDRLVLMYREAVALNAELDALLLRRNAARIAANDLAVQLGGPGDRIKWIDRHGPVDRMVAAVTKAFVIRSGSYEQNDPHPRLWARETLNVSRMILDYCEWRSVGVSKH